MEPNRLGKNERMDTSSSWKKMVRVVTLGRKGRLKPKGLLVNNQTALESD